MTTYTLTNGTSVTRQDINDSDVVTAVTQTNVTLELVVPQSTTSFRYTVDPLAPGDAPNEGNETVDIYINDYDARLNGTQISDNGLDPEAGIFRVTWTLNGIAKVSTILVLEVFGAGTSTDHIFVIDGDPIPAISTPAEWNAFEAQITGISVPTGTYGPNTDIALNSIGATVSQDDVILGSSAGETFRGGDGDDRIEGAGGNDKLFGGDGNDQLFGGNGADLINPGDNTGYDDIMTGKGNDTVDFSNLQNGYAGLLHSDLNRRIVVNIDHTANTGTINKGPYGTTTLINVKNPIDAGNNLIGGLGIYGTSKDDIFNVTLGSDGWMGLTGGAGDDTFNITTAGGMVRLDYRSSTSGVRVNLSTGMVADDGLGGTDTITGKVWEVHSSMANDRLIGTDQRESFILMAGNDFVDGRDGFDRVRYDRSGVDGVTVDLQAETATGTWSGQAFNHTLRNIEELRGSNGDDDLTGANGQSNRIDGRDGDDIIDGGNRKDTINGEDGKDDIAAAKGHDIVSGGNGADKLDGEAGNDTIHGDAGNDVVKGGSGADKLFGDAGNDRVLGGSGRDVLNGGADNDTLMGGADNDRLLGNKGRDKMDGGAGNDVMIGGPGIDTFIFSPGDDIIKDFTPQDRVDLRAVASITGFTDLKKNHVTEVGGDLVIDDKAGNTLTLENVTKASLQADDFLF